MAWVEAPRAVSSTARPTRPPCDVLRPSRPAAAQAAANRRLIWSTLRPTTASPGCGETAACRLRTAAAQLPTRRRTSARPPRGSDFERWTVTTTSSPSLKSTSAQQRAATPLRTEGAVEQQGDDRTVDQAAALGGLRALEAAAGAARAEAGGEDGGALVGGEASGLTAAGRGVGSVRSPKPLERAPGERPDRHGSAGIAGGALDGGDHHRSGRGRAAGLVKVPKVGGEARVVERSSLEPGVELAAGHGVGAAGVGRRRALEEPDRGLDAGSRDIGAGVTGLAGGHGPHDRATYHAALVSHQRCRCRPRTSSSPSPVAVAGQRGPPKELSSTRSRGGWPIR